MWDYGILEACGHSDKPVMVKRAFGATLEELEGADLLLHVVDISDTQRVEKIEAVHELLKDLNLAQIPEIIVYNKCDQVDRLEANALSKKDNAVTISALHKTGIKDLIKTISMRLWPKSSLEEHPNAAECASTMASLDSP